MINGSKAILFVNIIVSFKTNLRMHVLEQTIEKLRDVNEEYRSIDRDRCLKLFRAASSPQVRELLSGKYASQTGSAMNFSSNHFPKFSMIETSFASLPQAFRHQYSLNSSRTISEKTLNRFSAFSVEEKPKVSVIKFSRNFEYLHLSYASKSSTHKRSSTWKKFAFSIDAKQG